MWVINYFRVLPTDSRFKELSEIQKYLLFEGFMENPTPEQMHQAYWKSKTNETKVSNEDISNFKNLGYDMDQIKKIQEQLKIAGLG